MRHIAHDILVFTASSTKSLKIANDEKMLIMLYNPGTHTGLIMELAKLTENLTTEDEDLKGMVGRLVPKLAQLTDKEFDQVLDQWL